MQEIRRSYYLLRQRINYIRIKISSKVLTESISTNPIIKKVKVILTHCKRNIRSQSRSINKIDINEVFKDPAEFLGVSVKDLYYRSRKISNEPDLEPLWNKIPRETEKEYRDFWSNCEYIIGRQEWSNYYNNNDFEKIIPKEGNFLDYGCGTALIAFKLKLKRPDINIFLADISETATKLFVLWRMKKYGLNFNWFDIPEQEVIDFECKFDIIRCFDVLEHAFYPLNTVKNFVKHLNPRGYFIWTYVSDEKATLSNTRQAYEQRPEVIKFIKKNFKETSNSTIWIKKE